LAITNHFTKQGRLTETGWGRNHCQLVVKSRLYLVQ
jgi:hypothetical protein